MAQYASPKNDTAIFNPKEFATFSPSTKTQQQQARRVLIPHL